MFQANFSTGLKSKLILIFLIKLCVLSGKFPNQFVICQLEIVLII